MVHRNVSKKLTGSPPTDAHFFTGKKNKETGHTVWTPPPAIRRSVVRGHFGPPKTPESIAVLPLIPAVEIPLQLWCTQRGNPSEGYGKSTVQQLCSSQSPLVW
jgi:hypothetical protein